MYCNYCPNLENCKYFHAGSDQLKNLIDDQRPFRKRLTAEVDRVAKLYKDMYGPNKEKICTRLLTGLKKCRNVSDSCAKLEDQNACKYIVSVIMMRIIKIVNKLF